MTYRSMTHPDPSYIPHKKIILTLAYQCIRYTINVEKYVYNYVSLALSKEKEQKNIENVSKALPTAMLQYLTMSVSSLL